MFSGARSGLLFQAAAGDPADEYNNKVKGWFNKVTKTNKQKCTLKRYLVMQVVLVLIDYSSSWDICLWDVCLHHNIMEVKGILLVGLTALKITSITSFFSFSLVWCKFNLNLQKICKRKSELISVCIYHCYANSRSWVHQDNQLAALILLSGAIKTLQKGATIKRRKWWKTMLTWWIHIFVLCINLRNVTVSSLHTYLIRFSVDV